MSPNQIDQQLRAIEAQCRIEMERGQVAMKRLVNLESDHRRNAIREEVANILCQAEMAHCQIRPEISAAFTESSMSNPASWLMLYDPLFYATVEAIAQLMSHAIETAQAGANSEPVVVGRGALREV